MATFADYLAKCPRCHQTALLVYGEASYRNLALFEAVPWSPQDEEPAEDLTDAAERRWRQQLPYKLYVCYLDFDRGTWQVAMARANEKLRIGQPLWRPHNCPGEPLAKDDALPDLPAVSLDAGQQRKRSARAGGGRS